MKIIDLNSLYENYLKKVVEKNPDKYKNFEALENDIGYLTDEWEVTPDEALGDISPKQFVDELIRQKRLYDYVEDCLDQGVEVADIVCFSLLNQPNIEEFLAQFLYSNLLDSRMFGAVMLKEKGSEKVEEIFLDAILNMNINDEVKSIAFDFLIEDRPKVVDKILNIINTVSESMQGVLVEIMAEYKGRKEVFYWIVTMLYRAENIALFAKLLGQYDDEVAIDILKGFAVENDIDYIEYLEIYNAVERLGGDFDIDLDFSNDDIYKYMHNLSDDEEN